MTDLYNYRRAKKFKLHEDLEVDDEFTANAKRPLPGWKRWENGYRVGSVYGMFGNAFKRFLRSNVGIHVDKVYSEFLQQLPANMRNRADVRDDFHRKVAKVEEINGKLYDVDTRYNREIRNPLWAGEFYRDPKSGKLSIMKGRETLNARYRNQNRKKEPIKIEGVEYRKIRKEFRKRIAPGVFETEFQDIWFKFVRHTYMDKESVYVRSYDTSGLTRWARYQHQVFSHYKEVEREYFTKQTVSKEEIKKLKLESYEYDVHHPEF